MSIRLAVALQLMALSRLFAQGSVQWKATGDTTGSLPGCSANMAISAISRWFGGYNTADSARLAMATAKRFTFTAGKRWTPGDSGRRIESMAELIAYVRGRHERHEGIKLDYVRFNGWRGAHLGFTPVYWRSADDLGPKPLPGTGKAEYVCHHGIRILNLAPGR